MKKTIYLICLLLASLFSYSQTDLCITTCEDESGPYSYFNYNFPVTNGEYYTLFTLNLKSKNNLASYESISVKTRGFKQICHVFKVVMIFEDRSHIELLSENNEYGSCKFIIVKNTLFNNKFKRISKSKLEKIVIINLNQQYEICEFIVPDQYKSYFINTYNVLLMEK